MPSQSRIGIDPNVLSFQEATNLQKALDEAKRGVSLVAITDNLVDRVWSDKPAQPSEAIFRLDDKYTGASVASKLHRVREQLVKVGSPGTVVSQLDEVAWLMNLRGSDIPYNPVRPSVSRRSGSSHIGAMADKIGLLRIRLVDVGRVYRLHPCQFDECRCSRTATIERSDSLAI